jgi:broad specificity phosphatase PhoE
VFGRRRGQAFDPPSRPRAHRRSRGSPLNLYLVRHARAGSRKHWRGPDDLRPLSKVGRRQADALVAQLQHEPIARIVSGPYVRCRQTVEPLAAQRRLPVELSDALTEGAPLNETLRLIEKVSDQPTVLCTHGDVIEAVLDHLREQGVTLKGGRRFAKGSTWVLEVEDGSIVSGRYEPVPNSG